MIENEQRWTGLTQVLFGLGITVLFFYMMAPFLVAILMGAVTAILCYPMYLRCRGKLPPTASALVVTLSVTLGFLIPIAFVVINGAYQLSGLLSQIRLTRDGQVGINTVKPLVNQGLNAISRFVPVNRQWVMNQAMEVFSTALEKITQLVGSFLTSLPSLTLAFMVVIVSAYFLIVDGARLLRFLSTLSPISSERSRLLYDTFERSCRGVVLGLLASSLVQALLIALFFLILGVPNAVLMGIIGVVMGMVPIVGTAPITIGAVIYLFAIEEPGRAIVMIGGAVLIGTCDNIVRTWVLKGQSEMHPLLALVSAFGAVNLFGPTGIFLGPIIAAVFVSFLRILSMEIRRERLPVVVTANATAEAPKAPIKE